MKKIAFLCVLVMIFASCGSNHSNIALIWTNQPEFALYAEQFNKNQSKYKVVVEYRENPAVDLINTKQPPDIVIGPWLKGERARAKLVPVNYLFDEYKINSRLFYGRLLDLGNIRGKQYLLPVSFNLPAIIFSPEQAQLIPNDFALSLEEIKNISGEFNIERQGVYTRMGFSPRWDSEFLYLTAQLMNAGFEEASPLFTWNKTALAETISMLRDWTKTVNTSVQAEDDFQFKYLYDPPYKLITGGRNLFSYMSSNDLFILPQEKLDAIDFRWITEKNQTPITDDIINIGICRKAQHSDAAESFLIWFFNEKTQKELLDRSRELGAADESFGISGGFSALKSVNEKYFPLSYPVLLGHLPPEETLVTPKILPNSWEELKNEIVIPYLKDAVSASDGDVDAVIPLEMRISAWLKTH
ncbi:carbohydrate ABC transporter substrate-binding protein [Brucepastera parasyntrophica]|uniref:carbohydrate ABC transporter substrate-binding protein n=1 Tax=Brucepastera parasyntrophica TaxID=2880008 RepID=UPI00210CFD0D|nr:carbohydrate ABC transporter substrate-binding protein [Brucepastera parasyntrophica]ULQ60708.1 carbohydrate ABC transporter substrate-binding protein [Brucepastera parasyntrophica]